MILRILPLVLFAVSGCASVKSEQTYVDTIVTSCLREGSSFEAADLCIQDQGLPRLGDVGTGFALYESCNFDPLPPFETCAQLEVEFDPDSDFITRWTGRGWAPWMRF